MTYLETLEKILIGSQLGDVEWELEDIDNSQNTPIEGGLREFIKWYKGYFKVL